MGKCRRVSQCIWRICWSRLLFQLLSQFEHHKQWGLRFWSIRPLIILKYRNILCDVTGCVCSPPSEWDDGKALQCPLQWSYIAGQGVWKASCCPDSKPSISTRPVYPRERFSILLGHQQRPRSCLSGIILPNRLRDSSSWFSVAVYSPILGR